MARMEFRTIIKPEQGRTGLVVHGKEILLLGSCFADNIGAKLRNSLFEVNVNPFGALYNPLSVLKALRMLYNSESIDAEALFEHDGLYHSFMFHTDYSRTEKNEAMDAMNFSLSSASKSLRKASVVILTLATTWVFIEKKSGEAVSNCHKLPASAFTHRCLSLEECEESISDMVELIGEVNPNAMIIFTVSPLRYTGLGAHGNQIAKSILLLAIDRIIKSSGNSRIEYFPAYEVMMDDLRDYRFYAQDMKHPSQQAIDYIFNLFSDTYFSDETKVIASEAERFTRRLCHSLMNLSAERSMYEEEQRRVTAASLIEKYPILAEAYNLMKN